MIFQVAEAAGLKHVPLPDFDASNSAWAGSLKRTERSRMVQTRQGKGFIFKPLACTHGRIQELDWGGGGGGASGLGKGGTNREEYPEHLRYWLYFFFLNGSENFFLVTFKIPQARKVNGLYFLRNGFIIQRLFGQLFIRLDKEMNFMAYRMHTEQPFDPECSILNLCLMNSS